MLYRVKLGIRLTVPLADVDGAEPLVVGYYRSYFLDATELMTAVRFALDDSADGTPFDLEAEATELADIDPEIVAMMPANKSNGDVLWRSGRTYYQEDDGKRAIRGKRPWYRRVFTVGSSGDGGPDD